MNIHRINNAALVLLVVAPSLAIGGLLAFGGRQFFPHTYQSTETCSVLGDPNYSQEGVDYLIDPEHAKRFCAYTQGQNSDYGWPVLARQVNVANDPSVGEPIDVQYAYDWPTFGLIAIRGVYINWIFYSGTLMVISLVTAMVWRTKKGW